MVLTGSDGWQDAPPSCATARSSSTADVRRRPRLYDPASGTWTATGSRNDERHSHAAILLPDGKVLVVGGTRRRSTTTTDSAELYDPDTESWTAIASMHAEREAIEAFLQPDGKVLVLGGTYRRGDGDPRRPSCTTQPPGRGPSSVTHRPGLRREAADDVG